MQSGCTRLSASMGACGETLFVLVAISSLFALVQGTTSHSLKHEDFSLYDRSGRKVVDFGVHPTFQSARSTRSIKTTCEEDNSMCVHELSQGDTLTVRDYSGECKIIAYNTNYTNVTTDCFPMEDYHWYGGPEHKLQLWPLEKFSNLTYAIVPVELDDMAVVDGLWYNSAGTLIFVDKYAPVFYYQNLTKTDHICITGRLEPPYRNRSSLSYSYYVCSLDNAKEAYQYAIENFISKPTGIPDENMIRYPIWSTWARYKRGVNDTVVREFAKEILNYGFNNSQLEVDDKWETCYGSLTFNTSKFPSMKNLTDDLHDLGFHVSLWTAFFIEENCTEYLDIAENKSYLVKSMDDEVLAPWWDGIAGVIDYTNPEAKEWWRKRVVTMMEENGIDAMKFDAGETSWMPQLPNLTYVPSSPYENYPGNFSEHYIRMCATFGGRTEYRTAHYTQDLPTFIRMLDKDSLWTYENGLKTLVTTLLQLNSLGYGRVLPDMIGGNAYDGDTVEKQLFIRWLQANTFMPALQFSYAPWDFDNETVEIGLKFTKLHEEYTDTIIKAMKQSMEDGTPVNPPIWWLDPTDTYAQTIDSEFLLGEYILVAPILDNNTYERDIYLPTGTWLDANTDTTYEGPKNISNYSAPLDTLPYFILQSSSDTTTTTESTSGSGVITNAVILVTLLSLLQFIML